MDAVKDHNEIRDAIRHTHLHRVGSEGWWQAVTACRIAHDDHMAEEERQDLADFRLNSDLALRHDIAVRFLRFESLRAAEGVSPVDKGPEDYVRQHDT